MAQTALLLGGTLLLLLAVVAAFWLFDRKPREPAAVVVGFFGWGAACGALVYHFGAYFRTGAPVTAALSSLWPVLPILAPLVVMGVSLRSFDCPADGVVYGAACALGFSAGSGVFAVPDLGRLVASNLVSTASVAHLACGCVLGFTAICRQRRAKYGMALIAVAAALAVHGAGLAALAGIRGFDRFALAAAGSLVVLMVAVVLSAERRVLSAALADEVSLGVLPGWTLGVFPSYLARVRGNWWPDRSERTVINRSLSRLAFRKRALRDLENRSSDIAWLEVVLLRKEIREFLQSAADPGA